MQIMTPPAFARPLLPYVVLDQNVLRDEALVVPQIERARTLGELIVLPDIALFEMTKNDPKQTMLSSLRLLSRFPAGVMLAHNPGKLLRQELDSGEPCIDIVDHEVTPWFRRLLGDLQVGGTRMLEELGQRVPAAQERHRQQVADDQTNKARIQRMVGAWKTLLGRDLTRYINHQIDSQRETFRLLLSNPKFHERVIRDVLLEEGFSASVAAGPSVAAYQFFCFAGLALKWLARGWDSRAPEKATNDLADLDHIVLAIFCRGLVSKDRVQQELYEDLSSALDHLEQLRAEACQAGERRRLLRARAKDVADALGRKYGVTRVVLFGSVAREEPTLPGDVDLYVEGLRPERWIDACVEADKMMGDIHVDLVPAESAHASVRESVMAEGETLYEACAV